MFICFNPVLQHGKCIVKAILKLVSFRMRQISIPLTSARIGQACKMTVWIGIFHVQLRKLGTKTKNYQQNKEEHQQWFVVRKYVGSSTSLHLPAYPHSPRYHLLSRQNNFLHTQAYRTHISFTYRILTEPLCTILQPSYSITFPPKIKNLNHYMSF